MNLNTLPRDSIIRRMIEKIESEHGSKMKFDSNTQQIQAYGLFDLCGEHSPIIGRLWLIDKESEFEAFVTSKDISVYVDSVDLEKKHAKVIIDFNNPACEDEYDEDRECQLEITYYYKAQELEVLFFDSECEKQNIEVGDFLLEFSF